MVQVGSENFPIIIVPRIDGKIVTQSQIKSEYSNTFVDDNTTPLSFTLEYKKINEPAQTLVWDSGKSSDSKIFFQVPNSVYAEKANYTIIVFWKIGLEKIYTLKPYHLQVEDVHNR